MQNTLKVSEGKIRNRWRLIKEVLVGQPQYARYSNCTIRTIKMNVASPTLKELTVHCGIIILCFFPVIKDYFSYLETFFHQHLSRLFFILPFSLEELNVFIFGAFNLPCKSR